MAEPRDQNPRQGRPAGGGNFRGGAGPRERRHIEPGPCPDSLDALKARFETIPAPYNFVPLAGWVHQPAWGRQVSLDLPFRDGACGEIPFTLVADTPLLVGAEQDKARPGENRPGEVHFVTAPDGKTYLVPGSALRGMLRGVIEIAGFGRMRQVDNHRYGLRDITRADTPYARRVNREINAGFLRRRGDGVRDNDRERNQDAKQNDFVFYDRDEGATIEVTDADWRAFLLIHGDQDSERGEGNASWPSHWRACFNDNQEIPVFWFDDGLDRDRQHRVRLGLARMPKLAWDWSIHDLIGHTHGDHLHGPEQGRDYGYDLADLLFGTLADCQTRTLKGRVSVGNAPAQAPNGQPPRPERHGPTILNGPKPTYFPNYIRQETGPDGRLAPNSDYATCIKANAEDRPEVRGFKRYPARLRASIQRLTAEQEQGSQAVANILHPLPAGARFSGSIRFHNLRPAELGALVWALTWGSNAQLRHGLGMGKPFGLGQVHFEIDWTRTQLTANTALEQPPAPIDPAAVCADFATHMQTAYAAQKDLPRTWQDSPQLRALLAMADPARAAAFPAELRHMRLQRCLDPASGRAKPYNEFVWAKQKRLVLGEYDEQSRIASANPQHRRSADLGSVGRPGPAGAQRGPGGHGGPGSTAQKGFKTVTVRPAAAPVRANIEHPWLKEKVAEIQNANHSQEEEVIGGKPLAGAWQQIEDTAEKAAVLAAITAIWQAKGWWDEPPGKGKRQVKAIYQGG